MKKLFNLLVAFVLFVGIVPVFADTTGKITITNAANGKEYKVYEILHLESYDNAKKAYAYKATSAWETFVNSQTSYFNVDAQGYVTWVENADVKAFAELRPHFEKYGYSEADLVELDRYNALCLIKNEESNYSAFVTRLPA